MTDKIESKGKTVGEAVNEALLQLGARKDEVTIEVLEEPKSGLFGILGGKQARVLVSRKPSRGGGRRDYRDRGEDNVAHTLSDKDGGSRRRGGRRPSQTTSRRDDSRKGPKKETPVQGAGGRPGKDPKAKDRDSKDQASGGRSSTRRRGGRGRRSESERRPQNEPGSSPGAEARSRNTRPEGRNRRQERPAARPERPAAQERSAPPERSAAPERQERSARPERQGSESGRSRSRRRPEGESRPRVPAQDRPSKAATQERNMTPDEILFSGIQATKYADPLRGVPEENLDQTLVDLTSGLLLRAGFPIRCEVKPGEYRQVRIVTDDSSAGMLIGRHGATVDSVEHLVERMAGMAMGDRVRMNLDINNYRRRREESLHERVAEAAKMVLENGRTYHMEPMCARERRIVHLQAEHQKGVRTFTMGGEGGKHVVLAPDNGNKEGKDQAGNGASAAADHDAGDVSAVEKTAAKADDNFDEFDDGPQPETNELVIDDDTPRPLI